MGVGDDIRHPVEKGEVFLEGLLADDPAPRHAGGFFHNIKISAFPGLAEFEHRHDAGMFQPGRNDRFVKETGPGQRVAGPTGTDHLQGDGAVEMVLPRLENDAHAAGAEAGGEGVVRVDDSGIREGDDL